jgi:phosphorylcholine metabolism protein LicD
MNKKVIVFLFVFLLLVLEIKWSKFIEPFKENEDHINFKLIDFFNGMSIKFKHKNFNVPLDQNISKENLLLFNEIMTRNGIPFWLSEGTALGVIRDNSFIPWDDDVDTAFMYTYREKFKEVIPELKSNGFVICGSGHSGNFISFERKGEKIDIDIVQKDGKCAAGMTSNANIWKCNDLLPYLKKEKVWTLQEITPFDFQDGNVVLYYAYKKLDCKDCLEFIKKNTGDNYSYLLLQLL